VPYAWVPQADVPKEIPVPEVDNSRFRVPGSPPARVLRVTGLKS